MFRGNRGGNRETLQGPSISALTAAVRSTMTYLLSEAGRLREINGIEFELNSILVEKWKGKAYRLVIQRQKRMDGVQDLWEGEYTYRCILTNDYESSVREIVEFYNLRGGKERIFDDMNNGFGWDRLPSSSWPRTLCSFFLQHLSVTSTRPLSKDLT